MPCGGDRPEREIGRGFGDLVKVFRNGGDRKINPSQSDSSFLYFVLFFIKVRS